MRRSPARGLRHSVASVAVPAVGSAVFSYDLRAIPGVEGSDSPSEKNVIWITNLVRQTDPLVAHYLFPNFLQCRLFQRSASVSYSQVTVGAETRSSEGYDLF